MEEENHQLKERRPAASDGLPLRPGAPVYHPSATAASAASAAAPTEASTPMENRVLGGMAGADPFPPSSDAVRPRPIHGWTGVGINAPTVRPPSAWFAGDEGDVRPTRNSSLGSTAPTGTARNAWTAPGIEEEACHQPADCRTVSRTLAEANKVIKIKVTY